MLERHVALLLHFYQPPWQFPWVMERIINNCYLPISRAILESDGQFTVNINASLLEFKLRYPQLFEFIENIGEGVAKNKVKLTHSAGFHAYLPLLEHYPEEIGRQIILNKVKNYRHFGFSRNFRPQGLFSPEMGMSPIVLEAVKELELGWTITDAPVYDFIPRTGPTIPYNHILNVDGVPLLFRATEDSNNLSQRDRATSLHQLNLTHYVKGLRYRLDRWFGSSRGYAIKAWDGETFGEHFPEYTADQFKAMVNEMKMQGIELVTIDELVATYPHHKISLGWEHDFKGSWSTSVDDLKGGIAHPRWWHPHNPVHTHQWELTYANLDAMRALQKLLPRDDPEFIQIRMQADEALNSCQYWQASRRYEDVAQLVLDRAQDWVGINGRIVAAALGYVGNDTESVDTIMESQRLVKQASSDMERILVPYLNKAA